MEKPLEALIDDVVDGMGSDAASRCFMLRRIQEVMLEVSQATMERSLERSAVRKKTGLTMLAMPEIYNYVHLYINVQGKITAEPVFVAGPSGFEPEFEAFSALR